MLGAHGVEVILANARESRSVPGRKSDANDAQWLQRLHASGRLRGSFRPDWQIAELRAYLRLRERRSDFVGSHIQHIQKALVLMNLQLHRVVSDGTGATGLRTVRPIMAGDLRAKTADRLGDVCATGPAVAADGNELHVAHARVRWRGLRSARVCRPAPAS